jgi:hypothetical protein
LIAATTDGVRQGVAGEAWLLILKQLLGGASVKQAVEAANREIVRLQGIGFFAPDLPPNGIIEQWQAIGGNDGSSVFLK